MTHYIMTVLAAFGLLMSLQVESSAAGATITPSATLERAAPSRFYKNSDWNFSLVHRGVLEDDLKILNYYQQQPPVIQELFSTAYKRLGADKNATFSKCPELREACRKNGITHLGGPMLGALAADGARVWMRTVEPAQVKVLVSSAMVAAPIAVRYAWAMNINCDFYNQAGLPAMPFRTDNWPLTTAERVYLPGADFLEAWSKLKQQQKEPEIYKGD